jgi:hypothetical protein
MLSATRCVFLVQGFQGNAATEALFRRRRHTDYKQYPTGGFGELTFDEISLRRYSGVQYYTTWNCTELSFPRTYTSWSVLLDDSTM